MNLKVGKGLDDLTQRSENYVHIQLLILWHPCVYKEKKLPQQYCRANASLFPIHLKTVRPCVKLYGLWSKTHKKYKWTVWSTDHKRQLGYLPLNFHVNLVEVKLEKICHAMLWTDVGYNEGSLRCLLLERSWVCNLSDRCREALLYCSGPELASYFFCRSWPTFL
jgi:hypothetical protein